MKEREKKDLFSWFIGKDEDISLGQPEKKDSPILTIF